jgi:membrane protease YdiL (CAAX protease family)
MANVIEPIGAEPQLLPSAKPWGYFATFGWAVLVYAVATAGTMALLYVWDPATLPTNLDFDPLMKNAWYVSVTTILSNIIMVGLLIVTVWIAHWTAKDYLALRWASRGEVWIALVSLAILLPALDGMAYLLGQPIIPSFVVDIYRNAKSTNSLPLLWLAIVIAAPVAEEIIFRGFLYRGWVRSTQRPLIGILVVTVVFALVHVQYNWFGVLQVFLIGLLLTWTRWRSDSTLLPMLMHVIANFYAMMQAVVFLDWIR